MKEMQSICFAVPVFGVDLKSLDGTRDPSNEILNHTRMSFRKKVCIVFCFTNFSVGILLLETSAI